MMADIPKRLPMLNMSSPPNIVLVWNEHVTYNLEANFEFAYSILHDDATMLILVPKFKKQETSIEVFF